MIDIDTPDFDRALAESVDGSFQRRVEGYLQHELVRLRERLQQGLSPIEFDQARKLEAALLTASDVIRFSSTSNPN